MLLHILQILGMVIISYVWYVPISISIKGKEIAWYLIAEALLVTVLLLNCYLQIN